MPTRKVRVYDPDSGGVRIPDRVRAETERRILSYAEQHFAGKYSRLDIRFRGQFCYIDAFTEPDVTPGWPPADWPETREEMEERLRQTPTHLCRLRYFEPDNWTFGFYTYSNERYELAMFPTGSFSGTPEDAFQVAASVYLSK